MLITVSKPEDIPAIFERYDEAIDYQKAVKGNAWKGFEVSLIEQEIAENRHYVIKDGDEVACTFVLSFDDELIWKAANKDKAVYIHRVAVNPKFRGKGFIQIIINWLKEKANQWNIDFIRLDTEIGNDRIKNYYISCGLTYKGSTEIDWQVGMPLHYKNATLILFEIKL